MKKGYLEVQYVSLYDDDCPVLYLFSTCRYHLGTGAVTIQNHEVNISSDALAVDTWHNVTVRRYAITTLPSSFPHVAFFLHSRNDRSADVIVDGLTATGQSPGSATGLNVQVPRMFVGGINAAYDTLLDGSYENGLVGCVNHLVVNGMAFDLQMDVLGGQNIESCDDFVQL